MNMKWSPMAPNWFELVWSVMGFLLPFILICSHNINESHQFMTNYTRNMVDVYGMCLPINWIMRKSFNLGRYRHATISSRFYSYILNILCNLTPTYKMLNGFKPHDKIYRTKRNAIFFLYFVHCIDSNC